MSFIVIQSDGGSGGGGSGSQQVSSVLVYNEADNVPSGVTTTVATYTAGGSGAKISKVLCSGMEYGKFSLWINSVLKFTQRAGPNRNVDFDFDLPLELAGGDIFDVKVTHFVTGQTPTFEVTIMGYV